MSLVTTFNGLNIITLPCDTTPGVTTPYSIEWNPQEMVSTGPPSFTGQSQTYDWMASWWEGQISFPPMSRYSADAWSAFILQCRGQSNAFMLGDPKAALPKGSAPGTPFVVGMGQTGYQLNTLGWVPSTTSILLPGDYIQVGYRLYKVLNAADSDATGASVLAVWPNLRDMPPDGTLIKTRQCKGLFRLAQNKGNKYSVNVGAYGLAALPIREAF